MMQLSKWIFLFPKLLQKVQLLLFGAWAGKNHRNEAPLQQ